MCTSRQVVFSSYKGLEMYLSKSLECQQYYCQPTSNIAYSVGTRQHKKPKLATSNIVNHTVVASVLSPPLPLLLPAYISATTKSHDGVEPVLEAPSFEHWDLPSSDPFFADQEATPNASLFKDLPLIHTNEQKCLIDLMKLVHDLNIPDYSFELILK